MCARRQESERKYRQGSREACALRAPYLYAVRPMGKVLAVPTEELVRVSSARACTLKHVRRRKRSRIPHYPPSPTQQDIIEPFLRNTAKPAAVRNCRKASALLGQDDPVLAPPVTSGDDRSQG